jgi:phenylpropionate dioxygenase-like ring-hydroxylating dioxygenase large terminal subunit
MHRDEQIRVIEGLMKHLDNDTNVDAGRQLKNPVSAYTNPQRAGQEWRAFFLDYPQVLGLSGDLPENGSFFTSNDLGKPILCTRDKSGQFHAFLNVCRHRGTIVETAERGRKNVFSCPFHAWSYSATGELVAVPKEHHFGEIDKSCHSLTPLPAVEKYGILWVALDQNATIDVDDLLGDLAPEIANWEMGACTRSGAVTYPHACNWKLATDTYGETYHFNTLHRDTLAQDFYGNAQIYDTYKRNHRMVLCMKSIDLLRQKPKEDWHVLHAGLPVYYLFPGVQLIVNAGGLNLIRIYPDQDDPNNSRSEISWYNFPEAVRDEIGIVKEARANMTQDERMQAFASVIQMEDYVAAASSQLGALSGAQDHVTFGRNEPALHHYHSTYNKALGLPPLEVV